MAQVKRVRCPHCNKRVKFKKDASGKWVGTVAFGGLGGYAGSTLGIVGTLLGSVVAMPATLVGIAVGALFGNWLGSNPDVQCPKCKKYMSI